MYGDDGFECGGVTKSVMFWYIAGPAQYTLKWSGYMNN